MDAKEIFKRFTEVAIRGQAALPAPPAGWEDPGGVSVEEPPGEDEGGDDEQTEDLVAARELRLAVAGFAFSFEFEVRLDSVGHGEGFNSLIGFCC
jgi:hypothetical protein